MVTNWKTPNSVVSVASTGGTGYIGTVAWQAPVSDSLVSAVQTSDNIYATADISNNGTHWLVCTDFNFASELATGSTGMVITGLEVRWERASTEVGIESVAEEHIQFIKAGTPVGDNVFEDQLPTTDTYQTAGGSTYLAGTTWTKNDVTNSTTGVRFAYKDENNSVTVRADHVQMRVHYT